MNKGRAFTALMPFSDQVLQQVEKFGSDEPRRWFTCPHCGASHGRGPINGVDAYRCLSCGNTSRRTAEESAVRELLNGDVTKAPPFLLAQLKKLLAGFDARQMSWRKP